MTGVKNSKFATPLLFLVFISLSACQSGSEIEYPGQNNNTNLQDTSGNQLAGDSEVIFVNPPSTDDTLPGGNTTPPSTDDTLPGDEGTVAGGGDTQPDDTAPSAPEEPVAVEEPAINSVPVASNDGVSTERNVPVSIDVLANDSGLEDGSIEVSVISGSANGTTVVGANNMITYTPNSDYRGSDSFSYQVRDKDNDMATASVSIEIMCSDCPTPESITLDWNPNGGRVNGYLVYFGESASSTSRMILDTTSTSANLETAADLALQSGDTACFRLKAYTNSGLSGFSEAICTVI